MTVNDQVHSRRKLCIILFYIYYWPNIAGGWQWEAVYCEVVPIDRETWGLEGLCKVISGKGSVKSLCLCFPPYAVCAVVTKVLSFCGFLRGRWDPKPYKGACGNCLEISFVIVLHKDSLFNNRKEEFLWPLRIEMLEVRKLQHVLLRALCYWCFFLHRCARFSLVGRLKLSNDNNNKN